MSSSSGRKRGSSGTFANRKTREAPDRINGRRLKVYKPVYFGHDSTAQKWGVPPLNDADEQEYKLALFLGTGRSGTMFTKIAMRQVGIRLGHEYTDTDGTVSHHFYVDSDWYPMFPWHKTKAHVGERLSDYRFLNTFHIVRHPYTAIPSIASIFPGIEYEFLIDNGLMSESEVPLPRLHRAALLWYRVNEFITKSGNYDMRFQLEEYRKAWPKLVRKMIGKKSEFPEHVPPRNKASGFRKTSPTDEKELSALDKALTKDIKKLARKYGYEI